MLAHASILDTITCDVKETNRFAVHLSAAKQASLKLAPGLLLLLQPNLPEILMQAGHVKPSPCTRASALETVSGAAQSLLI